MKAPHLFTSVTVAIAILLTSSLSVWSKPSVNPNQLSSAGQSFTGAIHFSRPKPADKGKPGSARGAGSRSCLSLAKKSQEKMLNDLNALVPEEKIGNVISVWEFTLVDRPTLWFYVPYASAGIDSIEFVLHDDAEEPLQTIPVAIPQTPGLVSVTLPKDKPGLEIGKDYNWFFKVRGKCAQGLVVSVDGWITRTSQDATLANQLKQMSPREKALLLAEKGIWYDALNSLAELRRSESNNAIANTEWTDLLKQTNMEALTSAPFARVASQTRYE